MESFVSEFDGTRIKVAKLEKDFGKVTAIHPEGDSLTCFEVSPFVDDIQTAYCQCPVIKEVSATLLEYTEVFGKETSYLFVTWMCKRCKLEGTPVERILTGCPIRQESAVQFSL
ncbi:MAG: hypothetical protein WCO33_00285 [bacterium]